TLQDVHTNGDRPSLQLIESGVPIHEFQFHSSWQQVLAVIPKNFAHQDSNHQNTKAGSPILDQEMDAAKQLPPVTLTLHQVLALQFYKVQQAAQLPILDQSSVESSEHDCDGF